ncbi:hypothetical protein NSQ24_01355 [Brevibacillus sp. FSL L8-0520]|uniref:hypothetical protein n=1 Tax=Brevibacillus sp. FSL L8-0520 TaxID=2954689 RepID=UPI0030CECA44
MQAGLEVTEETHRGFRSEEDNAQGENCWSCGHWLIGGGCWKNGQMSEAGWRDTGPNDSCDEWVAEGTDGTITGLIASHNAGEGESDASRT